MSERRKPQFKKSKLVKILVILLIVAAVIAAALAFARRKVSQQFATRDENTVESVQVSVGEIGTSVSGSGTLSYEDSTKISVPQSVDITEVYVKEGQNVEAGEMLASVNSASVVQAMADVQKEMETLDADLDALGDEDTSETIKSTVSGRVKKVYVTEDDIISNVMYEHNALMLLSLDGKMALDIETDQVKAGDSVTVTVSDKDYSGTVDSVWAGKATITLTDNGPALNAKAKVKLDGKKIGSGKLYIHQELAVTGYTGKVSAVKVSENDSVSADQTLMTLTETSNTVNYATLLEQRAELEETLQNLITIYKEGAVYAKESGRITTYTEAAAATSTTDAVDTSFEMVPTDRMLLTLNVDETDILALEIGQTASITIDALGEDTYEGQVTDIDTVGSSSNGVTTFTCEITLAREEGMLRGMSGTALITIEGKSDALLLPSAAVTQMSDTSFVYTTYDEESGELGGMVEVVTGLNNGRNIEITSGLQEGDTVYYKEETTSGFDFSGMPGGFGGGDMPSGFSGGDMPSGFSAGDMPSGFSGGGNGGGMPSGGSGSRTGGGMPSGGGNGGGMPANAN